MGGQVEVWIWGHVSNSSVEDQLPSIERVPVLVDFRHVDLLALQTGKFVIVAGLSPDLPVEGQVHSGHFLEVERLSSFQYSLVLFPEIDRFLRFDIAWFCSLERANTRKADAFPFALGNVHCPCAIRFAITDGLDFIHEWDCDLPGKYKVPGCMLMNISVMSSCTACPLTCKMNPFSTV